MGHTFAILCPCEFRHHRMSLWNKWSCNWWNQQVTLVLLSWTGFCLVFHQITVVAKFVVTSEMIVLNRWKGQPPVWTGGCCFLVFLLANLEVIMGWKRYRSPLLGHFLQDIWRFNCRIYRVFEYKTMLFLCTAPKDSKDLTFYEVEHCFLS